MDTAVKTSTDILDPNAKLKKEFSHCGHRNIAGDTAFKGILDNLNDQDSIGHGLHHLGGHFTLDTSCLPILPKFNDQAFEITQGLASGDINIALGGLTALSIRKLNMEALGINPTSIDTTKIHQCWDSLKDHPDQEFKAIFLANLLTVLKNYDREQKSIGNDSIETKSFVQSVLNSNRNEILSDQPSSLRYWLVASHPNSFDLSLIPAYSKMLSSGSRDEVDLALASVEFYLYKLRPNFQKTNAEICQKIDTIFNSILDRLIKAENPNCNNQNLATNAQISFVQGQRISEETLQAEALRLKSSLNK